MTTIYTEIIINDLKYQLYNYVNNICIIQLYYSKYIFKSNNLVIKSIKHSNTEKEGIIKNKSIIFSIRNIIYFSQIKPVVFHYYCSIKKKYVGELITFCKSRKLL